MADGNGALVSTSEIDTPVNDPHASLPPENSEQVVSPPTSPSSASTSRLNARAPEYVPRTNNNHGSKTAHHYHNQQRRTPRVMQIYNRRHGPQQPPPPPVIHLFPPHGPGFHAPAAIVPGYAAPGFVEGEGGGRGMNDFDAVSGGHCAAGSGDLEEQFGGVSGDVARKVTKQVEYYFSDVNLATTEHLMRFISKDHEGFVPITVIASFKKIKALVTNNVQLSTILRTSKKLVVSDDGKKVRRQQPITNSDLEELQARIVVSENLPVDHCYQSLVKVFSVVGSVKTIRTCYPQTTNGASHANPKPGKMDTFLFNRLHAFVEYETVEQAERAIEELNDEGNWRSGLRVRMLPSSMKHGNSRGRKAGHEGDENLEDDDGPSSKQPIEKQPEDHSQTIDVSQEEMGEHHEEVLTPRKGRVRGRGGRGRGRGHQYHNNHNNSRGGSHPIGSPPSHSFQIEHHAASKPPGPQMPDGTRGFTKGRGKPLETTKVKP